MGAPMIMLGVAAAMGTGIYAYEQNKKAQEHMRSAYDAAQTSAQAQQDKMEKDFLAMQQKDNSPVSPLSLMAAGPTLRQKSLGATVLTGPKGVGVGKLKLGARPSLAPQG